MASGGTGQYQYRPPKRTLEMTAAPLPRVSVVGLGKLGAPLAAVLASRGFTVIGLDVRLGIIRTIIVRVI